MDDVIIIDNSFVVKEALGKLEEKFLTEAALVIESQVKQNTEADSHQTEEHWKSYVDVSNHESVIGNDLINAVYEEYGTGDYAMKPSRKGIPWYVPVEGYTGKKKPTYNGRVVIVSFKNGRSYYKTNGKKPRRALFKAFETKKSAIIRRAYQIAKEEFE